MNEREYDGCDKGHVIALSVRPPQVKETVFFNVDQRIARSVQRFVLRG